MNRELKKIDGILLLNKPLHITSNGALQRIKRLFRAKKAGHTGSLDPLATGMLPICFGSATKLSQFLLNSDKYYQVEAKLGFKTTTGDAEGDVIATLPITQITLPQITEVLGQFIGEIEQIPPMFSAIKYQGRPLYELARKGIEIERKPRTVRIHTLELDSYQDGILRFGVCCSKGTYVRTLVTDIGDRLGTGAYVFALHRLWVLPYQKRPMYTMDQLENLEHREGLNGLMACLLPFDASALL